MSEETRNDKLNNDTADAGARLQELVDRSSRIVFFGGAGVSTESGIKDFRSPDGLYHMKYKYPPETMLSHSFFMRNTAEFYEFCRSYLICPPDIKPNKAHLKLAELERAGKLTAVVTQNIDGLHQAAGSRTVYELHGTTLRNYCMKCGKMHGLSAITETEGVPHCECGGIIKPDVVLYEEPLNDDIVTAAVNAIAAADLLIVGGTSLTVYPAAGLIRYFRGGNIVLINRDATSYDKMAGLVIHDSVGRVLGQLQA